MADLSDVEVAIVVFTVNAVYPLGATQPSVTGRPIRVYRGWPVKGALSLDLAAGIANISVFALPGSTRNTTRWGNISYITPSVPTLGVEVLGNSANFIGVAGFGQLAGILVAGVPFVYRVQEGDTPAVVAAVLAQRIRSEQVCWLSGTRLSVPGVASIVGRVVADAPVITEWGRELQGFRVSAWCPDPVTRDRICSTLGSSVASTAFLTLADGTAGRLRYRSTSTIDDAQNAQLYRRDLVLDVEYATTVSSSAASMIFGDLQVAGSNIFV